MVIKRIGPMSCARIAGALYAVAGLALGSLFSLASVTGGLPANAGQGTALPQMFGPAAAIVFPILYGGLGFVVTLIGAWLYNIVAGAMGGIEVDIQ
ncbi:MAG: hypothetical protein WBD07_06980 [Vicinamibacterales bacterium]